MIYITEVRMGSGGEIEAVRWENGDNPEETGESTAEEVIDWIESKDRLVHVRDRNGQVVPVHVDRTQSRPLLKTSPDKQEWRDDLLDLPQY
jgi:hypothetical protein